MTTIAYKDGIMACDSHHTELNGWYGASMTKIGRTSAGALLGMAGDCDGRAVEALLDKVKNYNQLPTAKTLAETQTDCHAIIAFKNGEVAQVWAEYSKEYNHWVGGVMRVNRGGVSVGSGSGVALGAMDAGKTAREAVEYSTRRDPMSKAPVHVLELRPVPAPKKAAPAVAAARKRRAPA